MLGAGCCELASWLVVVVRWCCVPRVRWCLVLLVPRVPFAWWRGFPALAHPDPHWPALATWHLARGTWLVLPVSFPSISILILIISSLSV